MDQHLQTHDNRDIHLLLYNRLLHSQHMPLRMMGDFTAHASLVITAAKMRLEIMNMYHRKRRITIVKNLMDKYVATVDLEEAELQRIAEMVNCGMVFLLLPRSRLLTIKAGTGAQTRVRGFDKFRQLNAPAPVIEMALNAGIGIHNAMGMGCVEIISPAS